jgi:lambda family phage portal protein
MRILGADGRPVVPAVAAAARAVRAVRKLSAQYDAARTTDDNRKHWALADGLSATAAASPEVRRTLRNRSRYEVANNSYARGMVLTIANDCIGTGPRLQLTSETINDADATFVESEFAAWMQVTNLPEKLRVMRVAKSEDGEAFAVEIDNPVLPTPVKLDVQVIEADQCTSVNYLLPTPSHIDGIRFDTYGNPTVYEFAKQHPGDPMAGIGLMSAPEPIPAARVFHWFRQDRPGQRRGVPEITPALPLFAQLRRYTLAVIAAAETAADIAAYLQTDGPAGGEADEVEPLDTIPIEQRTMMTLPAGWTINQLKAEQPATGYKEFKNEILNEIARCQNLPFNVAAGNSSGYNYSSGRLDHQIYFRSQEVDRAQLQTIMLDRLFANWKREAILIEGYLPQSLRTDRTDWSHQWFWDGGDLIDPEGESKALGNLLEVGGTTLADHYARKGQDWQKKLQQRAREIEMERKLGIRAPLAPIAGESDGAEKTDAGQANASIQDASLNGAQITSLAAIISAVAAGQIPLETARGLIVASFTTIDENEADRILAPLKDFTPTPQAKQGAKTPQDAEASSPMNDLQFQTILARLPSPGASPGVVVQSRYEIRKEDVADLGAAISASIQPPSFKVEVNPTPVHIDSAPVHVHAAEVAAPVIHNHISPTPVTIDNQVIVEQRPIIAEDLGDGRVRMTPQEQ